MRQKRRKFSPEFKEEAVKAGILNSRPVVQVARELDVHEGTLGKWVADYRREHADEEPPLTLSERARLREAEREVRELKMENEFLKKVIMPAGAGTATG
jgi:transposase